MSKRFKAKKRRKIKKIYVFMLILFICAFVTTFKLMQKLKISESNSDIVEFMLEDTNHHLDVSSSNLVRSLGNILFSFNPKEPLSIISDTFLYQDNKESDFKAVFMSNEGNIKTDDIVDENKVDVTKPVVYLYNTHGTEEYSMENREIHNITPNVLFASYVLKEKLTSLSIPTIIEERSVKDYLNSNNLAYYQSYNASRVYFKEAMEKYPSLNYFIDIHRDSIKKDASTAVINGVSYAKVMFVVGLDNPGYQSNLDLTNKINDKLKEKYPEISRGISTKQGEDVNGIYNQDLHKNAILIECGGVENTIDEVSNTMNIIGEILSEVINS